MGIYNDKKDYEELVKDNITRAKLFHSLSKEDISKVEHLLKQKEKIKEKNGLLANLKINRINKKIEKIRKKHIMK